MIKEVLYLGIKSCPHRAATSDLVQRRILLVYVEDWRCGHVSEIVSSDETEFMRLACSVGPWLGSLSWLQTCSASVKIATQPFIYKACFSLWNRVAGRSRVKSFLIRNLSVRICFLLIM